MKEYVVTYFVVSGQWEEREMRELPQFSHTRLFSSEEAMSEWCVQESNAFKTFHKNGGVSIIPIPGVEPEKDWRMETCPPLWEL